MLSDEEEKKIIKDINSIERGLHRWGIIKPVTPYGETFKYRKYYNINLEISDVKFANKSNHPYNMIEVTFKEYDRKRKKDV